MAKIVYKTKPNIKIITNTCFTQHQELSAKPDFVKKPTNSQTGQNIDKRRLNQSSTSFTVRKESSSCMERKTVAPSLKA